MTAEGTEVGTIREVDGDRATVDRDDDASLTDKVKSFLGWDGDSDELRTEHIDSYDEGRVRLRNSP
ncbi:hypothetical protein [Haloprofundus sp. MHR1]|uniref:hypothetical protein n=1 Tax=Haloprofundus sp. MHR1 TaxID=2572921 RepID=UPI0010BEB0AE|nr:hypothetical protein [Haloprofundus sp. MHR1]QCJ47844.1 hypothetical protein FCF25_12270 [Haloprofundus sp. MHR1]